MLREPHQLPRQHASHRRSAASRNAPDGRWLGFDAIDQSKVRLERLGFFEEVNVETPAVPGTDDMVDVNYAVEEQASGFHYRQRRFAQSAGLILGRFVQDNFLGTGNKVSIGLTRSEYQKPLPLAMSIRTGQLMA